MTRDEAVARIKRRLSNRTDSALDTTIVDELQFAQEQMEHDLRLSPPWFLLEELSDASTTALEERLPLPSDFLQEYEQGTLWLVDTALEDPFVDLPKGFYQGLKHKYPGTGQPKAYSLDGKYFRLHPTPDAVYTMRMLYYKKDAVLDTDIENEWLQEAPGVLWGRAGLGMAEMLHDDRATTYFATHYREAREGLAKAMVTRSITNRGMVREDF